MNQLKRQLSIWVDIVLLISFLTLLCTLIIGDIRWKISFFRLTIKYVSDPLEVCLILIIVKMIFNLNDGIFASLAKYRIFLITSIALKLHKYEQSLRIFYIREKMNLALTVITCLIVLGFVEYYFRSFPHTLPLALGNHLASGYNDNLSGIYRYRADMKMLFMRPHYKRSMYFNGYYWHHQTDVLGFRNPEDREYAQVVLLGDSMIYGHGVKETSTVRHYLEMLTNQPVVNLGIQGGSIHQEYQILKKYGVNFKPKYVYLFFLFNDIYDLTVYLSDKEMNKFISSSYDDHSVDYFQIKRSRSKMIDLGFYLKELYIFKSYQFFREKYIKKYRFNTAEASDNIWKSLEFFQKNPRHLLAINFHLHTLQKMQSLANIYNFQFTNVFIYTGVQNTEESMYEKILERFCRDNGIDFYNLRNEFAVALGNGDKLLLPFDGHFSDDGAHLVAKLLAQHIQLGRR